MSKQVKVLVSVVVLLLLTVGIAVPVMAQEDSAPPEESSGGILARVAEILNIPEEEMADAFKQARQEMRDEAFFSALDKAVEEGLIGEEEAEEIKGWWAERPEVLDSGLLRRAFYTPGLQYKFRIAASGITLEDGCIPQEWVNGKSGQWQNAQRVQCQSTLRARISQALRKRQFAILKDGTGLNNLN